MKKWICIIFVITHFILQAQEPYPSSDSIRIKLSTAQNDSARVIALNQLANYYLYIRPDSSIYYANEALNLARSLGDDEMEGVALSLMAWSYHTLGNNTESLRVNLSYLELSQNRDRPIGEAIALDGLAFNYEAINRPDTAIILFDKALAILQESPVQELELYENVRRGFIVFTHIYKSITYRKHKNYDSAYHNAYMALSGAKLINTPVVSYQVFTELGMLSRATGALDSAFYYFDWAFPLAAAYSNDTRASILLEKARCFESLNHPDSAKWYAQKSLALALNYGIYARAQFASEYLVSILKDSNPKEALLYNDSANTYRDSVEAMRNLYAFKGVVDFSDQQKKYELDIARKSYQSRLRTGIFIGSLLTLLLIVFFAYRSNRQTQRAKKKIEEAFSQLKSTQAQLVQSEKMASLGELTAGIAHEIQNPLNFVNNFTEVSEELIQEMESELETGNQQQATDIAKEIKQNLGKILLHGKKADSIVKSMLQHSSTSSGQKEPTGINALCDEYLRLAYHGMRARDKEFNAELQTDFDPSIERINVVPQDIGRVLLNLYNNAFQAVSEKSRTMNKDYQPKVSVITSRSDGKIEIEVNDNGPGIPDSIKEKIFQPFFTTKPTGQGTGLGLSLSYDIIKAHGGEIKVESRDKAETNFIIILPVK